MILRAICLTLAWLGPLASAQDPDPRPATPADGQTQLQPRTHYFGREIARTMHWKGADWLLRETREDQENGVLLREHLGLEPGQVVCDLGCGNGYHTLPMARAVGPQGRVLAVDIQPEMLARLDERARQADIGNIESIRAEPHDPRLPPGSCDLILMVDVYHELDLPEQVLGRLRAALKPRGRLVLVEFRAEDPEVKIKPLHRMSKAQVLTELPPNGFRFVGEYDDLPWQHVVVFGRDEAFPRPEGDGGEGQLRFEARQVALGLWRALSAGDLMSLEGFYAEAVRIEPGTEFLKEEWGSPPGALSGARSPTGAVLARREWMECYRRGLEVIGRERWRRVLGAWEPGSLDFGPPGQGWTCSEAGDLELRAGSGSDDTLGWLLRRDPQGRWRVVAEATDY